MKHAVHTAALLLVSASLLGACGRKDENTTAGQKVDQVIASTERKATELGDKAREAGNNTADTVATKARDMTITTSVNAKLAADERLSALAINVDTVNGRVVLRGTAPDAESRTRATTLAQGTDGVTNVTNEISVEAKKP